ncbi:uncharacterized protein LOC143432366 [Xylocopa sonorina]|uniref:uncharacterized protein LOC143432366 n=1 Tax=Xylocopa sonorina TaxID=1818115 RepID=UPI00403AD4D3
MSKRKEVQKENHISYFFGGTAIGIAAGLLAAKLFSNTLNEKAQNIEPKVFGSAKVNNDSQDNNIYSPYFHRNMHNCCICSKNSSKCKDKSYTQQEFFASPLKNLDDIQDDINNLDVNYECVKSIQKKLCDNKIDILYKNNCSELEGIKDEYSFTAPSNDEMNKEDKNLLEPVDSKRIMKSNESIKINFLRLINLNCEFCLLA